MVMLTLYGIHDGEMPPVLLTCGVAGTSTKQMLDCTDQSEVKDGQEKSPLFQTVRCISGQAIAGH